MSRAYVEREEDWGVSACGYPAQWLPILKGTNRKLHKEYRSGLLNVMKDPTRGALFILVRLYTLSCGDRWPEMPRVCPKVWGVSYYRPAGETVYLEYMEEVDTPLKGSTDPNWKCPDGYVELKHRFWSKEEALNFYAHLKELWEAP